MRCWFLPTLFAILAVPTLVAGILTPSGSWRKPNITQPLDDRLSLVTAGIEKVFDSLEDDQFASDAFYVVAATLDAFKNETTYRDQAIVYFTSTPFAPSPLVHGLAAIQAYEIYQSQVMLDLAVDSWVFGRAYTISEGEASRGKSEVKNFTLNGPCGGATLAGGTFWSTDAEESTVPGFATGGFFALSAYLAVITGNDTYLEAARESGTFMISNLNITNPGNGKGAMSVKSGDPCTRDAYGGGTFRLDHTGYFLDAISILPPTTQIGSTTVEELRSTLVDTTITSNPFCSTDNGVVDVGDGLGNLRIVRGLGSLYRRGEQSSDLHSYIGQYLGIQYNSVIDLATEEGSNIYAGSWRGPPVQESEYDERNQTRALQALVSGAQVTTANPSNSPAPTQGDSDGKDSTQKSLVGPIVGAVVGGLVLLSAVALWFFCVRRRRQQRKHDSFIIDSPIGMTVPVTPGTVTPMILPPVTTAPSMPSSGPFVGLSEHKRLQSRTISEWDSNASSIAGPETGRPIPTEELVRLLQERIQDAPTDGVEPPAYDGSRR